LDIPVVNADVLAEPLSVEEEEEEEEMTKPFSEIDRRYMRRALALAAQAKGKTRG